MNTDIALGVKSAQIDSPIQSIGQVMGLQGVMQGLALQRQQQARMTALAQQEQQQAEFEARKQADSNYIQGVQKDPDASKRMLSGDFADVAGKVSPDALASLQKNVGAYHTQLHTLTTEELAEKSAARTQIAETAKNLYQLGLTGGKFDLDRVNQALPGIVAQLNADGILKRAGADGKIPDTIHSEDQLRQMLASVNGLVGADEAVLKQKKEVAEASKLAAETTAATELGKQRELTNTGKLPVSLAEKAKLDAEKAQFEAKTAEELKDDTEAARHNRAMEGKQEKERLVQVAGPNGTPIYVRESEAVGKPAAQAARSVTGQERKTLSFYNRGKEALETLTSGGENSLESKIAKSGFASQVQGQYAPNFAQSADQQRYRQAQRAFTEARLRQESGAAVPQGEYDTDAKTYFMQPNDDAKTIEQKRKARETVLEGLKFSAGRAYDEFYGEPASHEGGTGGGKKKIRAVDPQGNVHEAEEGTALPAGWKLK